MAQLIVVMVYEHTIDGITARIIRKTYHLFLFQHLINIGNIQTLKWEKKKWKKNVVIKNYNPWFKCFGIKDHSKSNDLTNRGTWYNLQIQCFVSFKCVNGVTSTKFRICYEFLSMQIF